MKSKKSTLLSASLGLCICMLAFQNCSKLSTQELGSFSSASTAKLSEENTSYASALNEAGDGRSAAFQGQTGIYFWGSNKLSSSITQNKPLEIPAKRIAESGFRTIRLAIGPGATYNIDFSSATAPTNLKSWLQVDEMRNVLLSGSFPLIVLTATDYSSAGASLTNLARLKTESFRSALFNEYLEFYIALFQLPVSGPKTFVVSNWEGDNQIFWDCKTIDQGMMSAQSATWIQRCADRILSTSRQSLNDTIDAYTIWNGVRKAALLAARAQFSNSLVDVRFAIEFNQVNMINRDLSRSVLYDVIPTVKPDLVLYSSYESVDKNSLSVDITKVRQFLNSKGLNNTTIAIGEIGRTGELSVQRQALQKSLTEVSRNDVAFSIAWNAFNEEDVFQSSSSYSMGLWFPNGALNLAPTSGRLVPALSAVPDVSESCFSSFSPTCELTLAGAFPAYALNLQSADLRCSSNQAIIPVQARYITTAFAAVSLPLIAKGQKCQIRLRSDLGFSSDWSNFFRVGIPASSPPPAVSNTKNSGYDIIVVGGQSNSTNSGFGPRIDSLAGVNDEKIDQLNCMDTKNKNFLLDNDEASTILYGTTDFLHDCQFDNPKYSSDIRALNSNAFAISFARQYAAHSLASGRKILIVAGGATGTGSINWSPASEEPLLENLLARTIAALQSSQGQNHVVAFLWSQGEADIGSLGEFLNANPSARNSRDYFLTNYAENLATIISHVRTRLNNSRLPFLISEKAPQYTIYQVDKLRYQDMDRWVAQNIGDAAVISANGLSSNSTCDSTNTTPCEKANFIHFSAQANVELGLRFHQAYKTLRPNSF